MGWIFKDLDTKESIELEDGLIFGRTEGKHKFPGSEKMSRSHARIEIKDNIAYIIDLNSRNGTKVNVEHVDPKTPHMLQDGVQVDFGGRRFKVEKYFSRQAQPQGPAQEANKVPRPNPEASAAATVRPLVTLHQFSFKADTMEMVMLFLKNMLITILTLGLYFPFAQTNMRKFMWKSTSLNKTPLLFTGDPMALFKGYILLAILFGLANILLGVVGTMLAKISPFLIIFTELSGSILIWLFVMRARFTAYGYLVNNTSYRSIKLVLKREGTGEYFKQSLIGLILTFLTLGLYYPFMEVKLDKIKWKNTSFGNHSFKYNPDNWEFAKRWYVGILLCMLTFGLYVSWFLVKKNNFKLNHLKFMNASFTSKLDGTEYFWLQLKLSLLVMCTLGLALPYVFNRQQAHFIGRLAIKGAIDFDGIVQGSRPKSGKISDALIDSLALDGVDAL